jgi:hypothetical protein
MAHERDDNKYDGQEDGEYHFSDDQGGYESEPEIIPTKAAPAAAAPAVAVPLKDRINQYRKQLIGIGVFFLLIFLVYKISAPSTNSVPNTDFAQNAGTIPSQKPVMKQLPKVIKVAQTQPAQSADFQPLPQAAGMSTANHRPGCTSTTTSRNRSSRCRSWHARNGSSCPPATSARNHGNSDTLGEFT